MWNCNRPHLQACSSILGWKLPRTGGGVRRVIQPPAYITASCHYIQFLHDVSVYTPSTLSTSTSYFSLPIPGAIPISYHLRAILANVIRLLVLVSHISCKKLHESNEPSIGPCCGVGLAPCLGQVTSLMGSLQTPVKGYLKPTAIKADFYMKRMPQYGRRWARRAVNPFSLPMTMRVMVPVSGKRSYVAVRRVRLPLPKVAGSVVICSPNKPVRVFLFGKTKPSKKRGNPLASRGVGIELPRSLCAIPMRDRVKSRNDRHRWYGWKSFKP